MSKIISSQHYLNDEIVAAKRAAADYVVLVSPEFEAGGEWVRVILDGHHAFAAARADGVSPEYVTATEQTCDRIALLVKGHADDFLELCWIDGDYYDAETGANVWG